MFSKKQQTSSTVTVIAQGSVVEGTMRARGMLQVDGLIDGTLIVDGHVSVGPEGEIRGHVTADNLAVGGRVQGRLEARGHLHVLRTGHVCGDVRYTTLEVDRGGVMDGRASHTLEGAVAANDVELVADEAQAAE